MDNGFYLYSSTADLITDLENEIPVWCEKGRIKQVQVNSIATSQDGFVVLFPEPEQNAFKIPARYAYSLEDFFTIPFCKELPALSHFIDVMQAGNYWDFYNLPSPDFINIKNIANEAVKNGFKPNWPTSDKITTPPAVASFSASWDHLTSKIILTWTPIPGAPLYRIYYNTGTNVTLNSPKIESLFGNTYEFSVLPADVGKTFYFRIQVQYPGVGAPLFPAISNPAINRTTFIPVSTPSPEINIQVDSANVLDGDTYNFGTRTNGSLVNKFFIIQNIGTANLVISNITIVGSTKFQFTPLVFPLTIIPSGNAVLPVNVLTDADGIYNAVLNIFSNDSDEATYNISLEAEVVAVPVANVDISTSSDAITDNSVFNLGGVQNGQSKNYTFNIKNTGDAILNISSVLLSGIDAGLFSILSFTGTPINPNSRGTIVVTFAPIGLEGIKNAAVTINTNDPDSPFVIDLTGYSYAISPKLEFGTIDSRFLNNYTLLQNNNSLTNGGVPIDVTYKIFNSGNDALNNVNVLLSGDITNSVLGIIPVELLDPLATIGTILPGQSADVTLRFNAPNVPTGSILGNLNISTLNGGNLLVNIDYFLQ